ncbi:methylmalonyl-CoA mutase [Nitrososphaera sp.]|uniref:acyl-CoA mutase large subunit family protein n=1 Tax=Nitrososphaera sp. TaxID=1971748 RepID=UPI00179A3E6D|nr:methylmalonyl-CoA mutase family protein [Nitrososphaera sp.]NWG36072.1 methylmalonyl-CoA mutase [Nitrososphaera sp.]
MADKIVTDSNIPVKRVYKKSDIKGRKDEDPGKYPYTRGLYPNMYRERLWTMRQYSGFGSAEETNKRFKFLLDKGQTGLSLAFDLPTQTGRDSDHQMSEGEVGRTGVAISSIKDMMTCFEGIPLDKVSSSMTINSTASTLLSLYITVAESQGVKPDQLRGTTQNDILKEYIARNTYIYPPKPSMRLIGDMIEYCSKKVPQWYPISISGYHIREAGSNAVQELAFTFADAIEYVETCTSRGLKVDDFAPRLSFFFCCTMEFFEEIAKFRAARRIYAKIMKERFKARSQKSMHLRFHVQTSGESLTAQQVDNNIVRVATEALSAVLGGCQSLHTNSRDEALALPTEQSAKVALRTQQILGSETGVVKTVDPLAGSYYVESLTDEIEEQVWKYLKRIDRMGGAMAAIEKGYFQEEIRNNSYRLKKEIDENKRVIVGVNKYQDAHDVEPALNKIDLEIEQRQVARLKEFKSGRDVIQVDRALSALQRAAEKDENLMPYIITCVKSYTTLGEISNTLGSVFGKYEAKVSF